MNDDESSQDCREEQEHREFKITKIGRTATITFKDGNEPSESKPRSSTGRKGRRLPKEIEMADSVPAPIKREDSDGKQEIQDDGKRIRNVEVDSMQKHQNQEEEDNRIDDEMVDVRPKGKSEGEVSKQEEKEASKADKKSKILLKSSQNANERTVKSERKGKLEPSKMNISEQ